MGKIPVVWEAGEVIVNRGENWESTLNEEYCSWKGLKSLSHCAVPLSMPQDRDQTNLNPFLDKDGHFRFCCVYFFFKQNLI